MKKILLIIVLILIVIIGAVLIPEKEINYDYLRIHIRANSNNELDQKVKYQIKDVVVGFMTPYLCDVSSKAEAIKIVEEHFGELRVECLNILRGNGFDYSVNLKINNEFFPTRTYANTTLESGYYDAVIVELGEAQGDNWWCVMYPPLCFVNKNENTNQIKYKSVIVEWLKKHF